MDSDTRFMNLALGQAQVALTNGWIPVGAVFVKNGKPIGYGVKDGTAHSLFDHAEHNGCYQCLREPGMKNLAGVTVYSTLEPCLMCLSMLMTTRVSRIVFACEDPYGGGTKILKDPQYLPERFHTERPLIEGGVLREESRLLLQKFFKEQRRKKHKNWSDPENPLVELALG